MLAVAHSAAHAEQRYAVLVGANAGWSSDRPLRYAESDAERMRDVLVTLGGFAPEHVSLLRDPDTKEIRATLQDLARTAQSANEDTLVFFYYSGHADNERVHLRGDPLTFKELRDTLRAMSSTLKLAVIDACKSGAVTRKGGSRVDEFEVSVESPKLSGLVLLTSSGADELSQESRALAGSVFTHHLVSGLRGAADENGDKQVTISEAYHYAYTRTRADTATTGTPQRPSFQYELSGQGELVLAQLRAPKIAKVTITIPKGDGTKYVVLDEHELRLVAEARSETDREVELTLAPGKYHVKKVLSDRLEIASIVLAAGEKAATDKVAYESAPLSRGIVKGSTADLSPEEQRDWQRTQAFGLLAAGNANGAITVLDQLIRSDPSDIQAWRGRARALIRIAEAYEAVKDHNRERLALTDAIKADPTLAQDPSFAQWYQHLADLNKQDDATLEARFKAKNEYERNPRNFKHVGVGFDLLSARGMFTIAGYAVLKHMLVPRAALDLGSMGLDGGVVIAPYPSRWSPFLGVGAHVSFRKMGIPIGGDPSNNDPTDMSYSTSEMFGLHFRAEAGAQFVGSSGFTTELGLAVISFEQTGGKRVQQAWPIFHFGWVW
ncbi:MAG TPA: caspase family protein [Kofleriaceae bacterium]|nr:caspase family protein [Kofleriaceae bacterium]